jgi:hypothetical protein
MQTGLTVSPWADTTSPAAKTLHAALMSRSWTRSSKNFRLLRRRVKPEFVGAFNFHSGILQEIRNA